MTLILGGYSYGSLMTANLPTTEIILPRFTSAAKGAATAEIVLRAARLSQEWNKEAQQTSEMRRGRSLKAQDTLRGSSHSVAVGGDECEPGQRRLSRDSRSSMDGLRRSLDVSRKRLGSRKHSSGEKSEIASEEKLTLVNIPLPQTYYLLISPLLPPISMFATMFSKLGSKDSENKPLSHKGGTHGHGTDEKLCRHPTLAIYGDKDFFTSQRKLRKWAEHLASSLESTFQSKEISGAGHFWHEEGVEEQMREAVRVWTRDIVRSKDGG